MPKLHPRQAERWSNFEDEKLQEYRPHILVKEVKRSKGSGHRTLGLKTGRIHHLLSKIEYNYFLILDSSPVVLDIREQFPLNPQDTWKIACELGVPHHSHEGGLVVPTIDFMITVLEDGVQTLKARDTIARAGYLRNQLGYHLYHDHLKFCAQCVRDDLKSGIEPYFRRVHHVLGVCVCPNHSVYLTAPPKGKRLDFTPLANLSEVTENSCKPAHPVVVMLAEDIANCPNVLSNLDENGVFARVSKLLTDNGIWMQLPASSRQVHDRISSYLGDALPRIPRIPRHCGPLWGMLRNKHLTHPFAVLLLIRALGASPESIATATAVRGLQMKKAWPCRNPLCKDYRKTVISKIDASGTGTFRWGDQVALTCPTCSFSYLIEKKAAILGRNFPELRVVQFGALWNKEFYRRWHDPKCTINQIRTKMGFRRLSCNLLFQALEECSLPLVHRDGRPLEQRSLQKYLNVAQQKREKLLRGRENLSKLHACHPKLLHRELMKRASADYNFAYTYDRSWFTALFGRKNNKST